MERADKTCACCLSRSLPLGSIFEICPRCGWQEDDVQNNDPNYQGEANALSLNQYRSKWVMENPNKSILRELKSLGIAVVFDNEKISTDDADSEHIITIIEAYAQAETESRVRNTRWGLEKRAQDGTLGLYKRRYFGYITNSNGDLQIKDGEAAIVRHIFDLHLSGQSLVGIIRTLQDAGIASPMGKPIWGKNTLDKLLSNEKYVGDVEVFKTFSSKLANPVGPNRRITNNGQYAKYVIMQSHPEIISRELFDAVQAEKARRTNVTQTTSGTSRSKTRYSTKRDAEAANLPSMHSNNGEPFTDANLP